MSEAKRHELSIKAKLDGKKVYASALSVSYAVDTYTSASITHFSGPKASSKSIEASNKDVFASMGKRQSAYFKSRSKPDANVDLKVDGKEVAQLDGYMCSTHYGFSSGSINQSDELLSEEALMDAFDASIYGSAPVINQLKEDSSSEYIFGKGPDELGWDIPKCISSILKDMVGSKGEKAWEDDDTMPDDEKEARRAQHEFNKTVFDKEIKPILSGSSKTFGWKDELSELSDQLPSLAEDIVTIITNKLLSASGNFLATLCGICDDFNCMFVPSTKKGKHSKLVNRAKVMDDKENLKIPIMTIDASAGSDNGVFPVLYAAVVCKAGVGSMLAEDGVNNLPWVCYPKDGPKRVKNTAGTILRVQAPAWFKETVDSDELSEDGDNEQEDDEMEAGKVDKSIKDKMDKQKKACKARAKLLKEWARQNYIWRALGGSVVTLATPMLKSVEVGKRYSVSDHSGRNLFTGFCTSVTHTVVSQGSRTAVTSIMFTHVEYPGFNLPK